MTPIAGIYGTLGSEVGLALRERLSPWQPARTGVIMCHGAGGAPTEEQDPLGGGQFAMPIVEAGFPFVSMDMGGPLTWGNSTATGKAANAVTQVEAIGAKTTGKIWIGVSMGSLTVLRSILSGAVSGAQVKAVGLMLPIPSLVDMHDNNRGGYAASMETAWGITGTWAGNTTIAAADPNQHPSAFTGFPIKMWYGTLDTIAIPSVVTSFASAVNSAGGNVTTQSAAVAHAWNVATAQNIRDFVVTNA